MHVVIAGGGKGGKKLVDLFSSHFQDRITVIESDPETCEFLAEVFPKVDIVMGSATHPTTLREAISEKTDVFVAITGNDERNLLAAEAAQKFGISKVILQLQETEYRELSKFMELTTVLDPAKSACVQVISSINEVDLSEVIYDVYPHIQVRSFSVNDYSDLIGKPVGSFSEELELEDDIYPILIYRKDKYRLPNKVDSLKDGDKVIAWVYHREGFLERYHLGDRG